MVPVVEPPSARHTSEDLGESFKIIIPSQKHWAQILLLSFQSVMLAFFVTMMGGILVSGVSGALSERSAEAEILVVCNSVGALVLLACLCYSTVVGALICCALLWQLTGKEIIEISPQSIKVRRQVCRWGRTKEYLAEYVKDLRVSPREHGELRRARSIRVRRLFVFGPIVFDYGAKTYRFGNGVDEAEAKQILSEIHQRFSEYRSQ